MASSSRQHQTLQPELLHGRAYQCRKCRISDLGSLENSGALWHYRQCDRLSVDDNSVVFSYWPTAVNLTPSTMNFSSLMVGATGSFSILYYIFWARRVYTGPVIEIDY